MVLEWDKDIKLYVNKGDAWFTGASFLHVAAGFLMFFTMKAVFGLSNVGAVVSTNVLHVIEDYMENTSVYSVEGAVARLVGCRNDAFLDYMDHDSLQNYLGDNFSAFVGSMIGYYIHTKHNIEIPLQYVIMLWLLMVAIVTEFCYSTKTPTTGQ